MTIGVPVVIGLLVLWAYFRRSLVAVAIAVAVLATTAGGAEIAKWLKTSSVTVVQGAADIISSGADAASTAITKAGQ